jgi:hypothetical protein
LALRRDFLVNSLDLVALSCLAVSQPIFDLLEKNVEFLAARDSDATDVVVLAVAVTLLVPIFLALVELIAGLIGQRTLANVHRLLVGILVFLLLLPPLKHLSHHRVGALLIVVAVLAAGVISETYVRLRSRGIALAYLSPIAIVLPALFVFHSPVCKFLEPGPETQPVYPQVRATAPIVMVVFDEFPLVSLMDGQGQINPRRYPNFAALAKKATWYRNASTVTESTLHAVPAILDGCLPNPASHSLPDARGHPHSLFTLLGGSYGMNVVENNTRLCPEDLCAPSNMGISRGDRLRSLFSDLGVLYLYLLLPSELTRWLPNITLSWEQFRFEQSRFHAPAQHNEDFDRMTTFRSRSRRFTQFVNSIQPRSRPTLNFLHILLPHAPWEYLPSGKRYAMPENGIRGLVGINDQGIDPHLWTDDSWALEQAYQRHLLQVEMVDRLVGNLVSHLERVDLFDPCLLVITADHGASFRAQTSRRAPTPENYADIMAVPLFIKAPFQEKGEISDRNIESIDILPTMAEILGIKLPWQIDGQPALGPSAPLRSEKTVIVESGRRIEVDARLPGVQESIQRKTAWFGSKPDDIFRIGSCQELIGQDVSGLRTTRSAVECLLDGRTYFENVDPDSDFVLTDVRGQLSQLPPGVAPPLDLAVAVNGRIRGVTQSYTDHDGEERFSSVLCDSDFQPGYNRVEVYLVKKADDGFELAETSTAEVPPYRWGELLRFGIDGSAQAYEAEGWSRPEDQFTWIDGVRAELVLPALAPKGPVRLRLFAGTYLNPGRLDRQRVRLSVNHRLAADWLMKNRDFALLETTVPRDYFGNEERTVITIDTPDATSPNSIGDGNDLRRLGLVVGWLSLGE